MAGADPKDAIRRGSMRRGVWVPRVTSKSALRPNTNLSLVPTPADTARSKLEPGFSGPVSRSPGRSPFTLSVAPQLRRTAGPGDVKLPFQYPSRMSLSHR